MRSILFASAAVIGLGVAPAFAQSNDGDIRPDHVPGVGVSEPTSNRASNIVSSDTRSDIAPTLPVPSVGPDSGPRAFLRDAQTALNDNRTGEAQEALERAESRMLDRGTSPELANNPDQAPMIRQVTAARDALGRGDIASARSIISDALQAPPAMASAAPMRSSMPVTTVAPAGGGSSVGTAPQYAVGPNGYGIGFVPGSSTTVTAVGPVGAGDDLQPSGVLSSPGKDYLGDPSVDELP